jgi:hypothetical protein
MLRGITATVPFLAAQRSFPGATNKKRVRRPLHLRRDSVCDIVPNGRILKFVSRAEHLTWRARWKNGRWVRLTWTPEERAAILRQDELYRQADIEWDRRHPKTTAAAAVMPFSSRRERG